MVKSELVRALSDKLPDLEARDVELAINCMIEHMITAFEQGERIEIRGFGSFNLHSIEPHIGRNPKTGEQVNVSTQTKIHFKPGKELKDRVGATHGKFKTVD